MWLPFKHISLMCYLKSLMIIITELSVESTLCLNPQKVTFDLLWALSMGKLQYFLFLIMRLWEQLECSQWNIVFLFFWPIQHCYWKGSRQSCNAYVFFLSGEYLNELYESTMYLKDKLSNVLSTQFMKSCFWSLFELNVLACRQFAC